MQEHGAFCREFVKVAERIDPHLKSEYPSKATFFRWLSGEVRKLPHPGRCRVLEAMFDGWASHELFEPWDSASGPPPSRDDQRHSAASTEPASVTHELAGIERVFLSRAEFAHQVPPHSFLDHAHKVRLAGLSLNMLCQSYPDHSLVALLESGCEVRCLFLDPDGASIKTREQEEHLAEGHLSTLTRLNMEVLQRVRGRLTGEARDRLQVRTYDEPIRFNITLIDDERCFAQPYMPDTRGVDSPTFVATRDGNEAGLYDVFEQVFESLWNKGAPAWPT
nr:DUF5919 domain-containing protein [Haloechinothrix aidingensis]